MSDLNLSSRGPNAAHLQGQQAADGRSEGSLGRRDPNSGASVMDHPDGHPHMTGPGEPAHHDSSHVHAVDRNGNELIVTYPPGG